MEIYNYTKAILRPIPDYYKLIKDHIKRISSTDRVDKNPSFWQLFIAYFRHPIEISPGLFIGNVVNASNWEQLQQYQISTIYNVSAELKCYFENDIEYRHYPIYDIKGQALNQDEFTSLVDQIHSDLEEGKHILVHCHHGRSRSATLIMGYLVKYRGMSVEQSYKMMKQKKPIVNLNTDFYKQLEQMRVNWTK